MNVKLRNKLVKITENYTKRNDSSHDITHAKRVLANAEFIGKEEHSDLDILIPAALFHDLIVSPKNSPQAVHDTERSAELAKKILTRLNYSKNKIDSICYAISVCSYSKNIHPKTFEAMVLQDADKLESTGAISIMRTFASAGSLHFSLYDEKDPFAKSRPIKKGQGLDLFFMRLLHVENKMHTKTAREIANRRTKFLYSFLKEFENELEEVKVN